MIGFNQRHSSTMFSYSSSSTVMVNCFWWTPNKCYQSESKNSEMDNDYHCEAEMQVIWNGIIVLVVNTVCTSYN